MKRILILFGVVVSLFLLVGCLNDDGGNREIYPVGGLTMVNGYTGSSAIWHSIDGQMIQPPYVGLEYKRYDFARLFTGTRTIDIKASQQEMLVINAKIQVQDQQYYTSFIGGNTKNKVIHFFTTDRTINLNEQANDNQSGIRFFNLTGEDLAVQVKLNDQVVFSNRNSETATSVEENQKFKAEASATYTVTIEDKEGKSIAKREAVLLEKGKYYSLILTGLGTTQIPYYVGVVKQF